MKTKSHRNTISPPNKAYTRQQAYDSDTNTLNTSECSPNSMSSAATLACKDERSLDKKSAAALSSASASSGWLYKRQKSNKRSRIVLGCIGLIVFMVLLSTVVLWVGSAFILPQNKYSTVLSHVPLSSSYSFHHPATTSHHKKSTTSTSSKPKTTISTKTRHSKYDDDDQ